FNKERRLGPWLVYDKTTGRVTLPREAVSFEREQVIHLQYVTTKKLDWPGVANNDRLSELNLITCRHEQRKRWPLLRSKSTFGAFDSLLQSLIKHTNIPVMRVQDEWLGWQITEKPYGPSVQN